MPFDNPQPPDRHAAILREAKFSIRHESLWTKGHYIDGMGICLIQAVRSAAHYVLNDEKRALRLLRKELPSPWRWMPVPTKTKLIAFNDWGQRTHFEVIQLLDRAITRAERTEVLTHV